MTFGAPSAKWIALTALIALIVAVELQARGVEESYLIRRHGSAHPAYASSAGLSFRLSGV
ncbi:hypothetical protein [Streptosporangium roseum]|uniref:hypothetical protein n=1 Tax=Streptosporangium roseum TaxID=2001 RepID=UPI0004CD37A0|nr:hypothetical protein [Streptosporangium roseum]